MGKASTKGKDAAEDAMDTESDSSESDAEEDNSPREETPDLYRNSALGM